MILGNVRASLGRNDAQLALRLIARGSRSELERGEEMLRDGGIDAAFPDFPNDAFDAAVRRAKELARSGRGDDAFAVLLDAMPQWFSFRLDNLAPTALIADRDLGPLITADRGRALLAVRRDVRQP